MNKYGNKWARCLSGHTHQSIAEANYCNRLLAMRQSGEIVGYRCQVSFELRVKKEFICVHVVDFMVVKRVLSGKKDDLVLEAHEVKGFRTDIWGLKYKLFKALYPKVPYIIIDRKEDKNGGENKKRRGCKDGA